MADAGVAYIDFEPRFGNLNAEVAARMRAVSGTMQRHIGDGLTPQRSTLRRIGSNVSSTMANIGRTAGKALALGLAGAGVGIAIGMKGAIDAASDLEESVSKVDVVFGQQAATIHRWASSSAKDFGLSNQAALEAAGTFGNFLISMGNAPGEASKMSTSMVELAADLASFNNANPEDVLLALRSGLAGEAEPLRQFGVSLSAARVEAEGMASGINKSYTEMTAAEKSTLSYQIIMKDTALAQGDFERTSDGLANKQRIASAQWKDLQARLGKGLLPVVTAFMGFLTDKGIPALEDIASAVGSFVSKIVDGGDEITSSGLAGTMQEIAVTIRNAWDTIYETLEPVIAAIVGFFQKNPDVAFGSLAAVIGGALVVAIVGMGVALWGALSPVVLIVGAIALLVGGVIYAYQNFEWFRDAVDKAWQVIQDVTRTAWTSYLKPALEAIWSFIQNTLIPAWKDIWPAVKEVWSAVVEVIKVYWGYLQVLFGIVKGYITNVLIPVFKGIWEVVQFVWPAVVRIAKTYWAYLQIVFDIVKSYITQFLIPAFKTIWSTMQTVWNAVVTVVKWAWNNVIQPLWTGIKWFIDTVLVPVFRVIWSVMQTVWNGVVAVIQWAWTNVIQPLWTLIKWYIDTTLLPAFSMIWSVMQSVWDGVIAVIQWAWNTIIQPLWAGIKLFIDTVLLPVFNTIWTTMQTVWDTVSSIISVAWNEVIKPIWDGVISFIDETFLPAFDKIKTFISGVWDAIKSGASSAWDGIVGVIRGAVNGAINVINAIIGGINLVVGIIPGVPEIGKIPLLGENAGKPSGNRDTSGGSGANGPPLAVGGRLIPKELARMGPFRTNGPQAIVGEGNPRYPEYVIPTDPKYRGRALGLAAAMANDLGTPIPMMGIGGILGDAWDSIKGVASGIREGAATLAFKPANELAKDLISKIPVEFLRNSIDGIREGIYNWIRGKEVELGLNEPTSDGGTPGGPYSGGGGVERWRPVALQALQMAGQSAVWVDDLLRQMQHESGGNPNAINLWDSNAIKGTPSKGLMQTIDSTFNAYAGSLRGLGVYNPLANIFAAINYTVSRYGSLGAWRQRGFKGYAKGGVLPFVHANSFDSGGVLEPGWNMVRNDTGAPEAVSPNGGPAVAIGEAHFHEGVDYDLFLRKTGFMAAAGVI